MKREGREYYAHGTSWSFSITESEGRIDVNIPQRDRDGGMPRIEEQADWLDECAKEIEGMKRVWGVNWELANHESRDQLESRLGEIGWQSNWSHDTEKKSDVPKLLALEADAAELWLLWQFDSLPQAGDVTFGQIIVSEEWDQFQIYSLLCDPGMRAGDMYASPWFEKMVLEIGADVDPRGQAMPPRFTLAKDKLPALIEQILPLPGLQSFTIRRRFDRPR